MRFTAALCALIILLYVAGTTSATLRASRNNSSEPVNESLRNLQEANSTKNRSISFVDPRQFDVAINQPLVFAILSNFSGYADVNMTFFKDIYDSSGLAKRKSHTSRQTEFWLTEGYNYIVIPSYPGMDFSGGVVAGEQDIYFVVDCRKTGRSTDLFQAYFTVSRSRYWPIYTKVQNDNERSFKVVYSIGYNYGYFDQRVVAISNATDLSPLSENKKTNFTGIEYNTTSSDVGTTYRFDKWVLRTTSELTKPDTGYFDITFSAYAPLWRKKFGEPAPKHTFGFNGPTRQDYVTVYDYASTNYFTFAVPDNL